MLGGNTPLHTMNLYGEIYIILNSWFLIIINILFDRIYVLVLRASNIYIFGVRKFARLNLCLGALCTPLNFVFHKSGTRSGTRTPYRAQLRKPQNEIYPNV